MKRKMKKYGLPEPEFYEERDSFKVIFRNNIVQKHQSDTQSDTQKEEQNTIMSDVLIKVLNYCKEPKTAREIREHLGISSKRYVAYEIIKPLIDEGKLNYTNQKSINARNQKYVTKDYETKP